MGPASRLLPLLLLFAAAAPRVYGDGPKVAWRLGRSDLARYERSRVDPLAGGKRIGTPARVMVHGHDLRAGGQYRPAAPLIDDLPQLLALQLPPDGRTKARVRIDWTPHQATTVRIKGELQVSGRDEHGIHLQGDYSFRSRGRAGREDRWWYDDGSAEATVTFDPERGVVRRALVLVRYRRLDAKAEGANAERNVSQLFELELQEVVRARPPDFQARVDAAIGAGVAHLRTLQEEDGSFKPHGGYRIGTTALAVFTLAACGVPRDDPQMKRALMWLLAQEPAKTYERATCLMAVDRAWTPAAELHKAELGQPVEKRVRDLPPAAMAWARRIAEALERSAASPGSWGYPAAPRVLLRFDSSNTQYAVLGLRAAAHLGYEVKERTWLGVIRHFALVAERDGPKGEVSLIHRGEAIPDAAQAHRQNLRDVAQVAGFRYSTLGSHSHVDSALTCAGISCLLIARDQLQRMESRKWTPRLAKEVDALLDGAWAWLQRYWAVDRHALHPSGGWYYYYLYSLERAGILGDVKRVGGCDWYFEGAMQLMARQQTGEAKKGAWNHPGGDATPPTCFALLFLKRGTSPLGAPVTGR